MERPLSEAFANFTGHRLAIGDYQNALASALPQRSAYSALHGLFSTPDARLVERRELTLPQSVTFTLAVAESARITFKARVSITESQIKSTAGALDGHPADLIKMILTGAAEAVDQSVQRSLSSFWRRSLSAALYAEDREEAARPTRRRRLTPALADEGRMSDLVTLTPAGEASMRAAEAQRGEGLSASASGLRMGGSVPTTFAPPSLRR